MLSELSENYCASSCRARAHPNVCLAPRPPSQGRSLYWRLADGLIREIRLPGNTQDGRTLRTAIEDTEELRDRQIERAYVDKAYRSHDTANPHRVFISGQKRGVFGVIKRELRRRSAIEAVIGHMKTDGHLGRCYLKGRAGDAANAILSAVGYNLRLVLAWLRILLCLILVAITRPFSSQPALKLAS